MNHPSLFVLVDPDPKGLETLAYAFKRDGCAIASTSNPKLAPEMVRSNNVRLVVVSVRPPEHAALDLISGLHIHPETKNLPIVALGPVALRPAALAAGAFDYLNTPLYVRDVISIARLVLLMREAAVEKNSTLQLRAPLSDYHGLYYLVRAMAGSGRSGILQLVRNNHKGEVRFCDGAVTSAETGSLQGFPALHQLLLWDEGSLSLKLRDVPRRGQFSLSAGDVLDECQRFLRDFTHAATNLGWPRTVYATDERRGALPANMVPSEVGPVARLFDGRRTLSDVIEESPFRVFDTLRIVKRLVDFGALLARTDAAPAPPARERTRTAAQGSRLVTPPVGVPAPTNRRGAVGDRRKSSKSQRINIVERPLAAAPAPIPLVVRKSLSPPTGIVAGEIPPRMALRPAHEARQPVAGDGPTVQVRLDGPRMSLDMPAAFLAKTPPPVRARALGGPSAERAVRSSKKAGPGSLSTPTPVFDAVESDFFAREADLYKREAADSFEDLERGQAPQARPGRMAAARTPSGAHKKK